MDKRVNEAIKVLNDGGTVIFPTDTAFGIGCRIDSEKAMARLMKIRGRKRNKPFPILISDLKMAKKYVKEIPKPVSDLMNKYWPGPLTIVLECKTNMINPVIRGFGETLGIRIPNNKIVLDLIRGVGVPIVGTSANYPDCKTPYSIKEIDPNLLSSADFVFTGECTHKYQSTVIDCSVKPWKIVRQGVVKISNIKKEILKRKKVGLHIDTSSNEYILVKLTINGKEYMEKQKINYQKAQAALPLIEKILKKYKLTFKSLTSITVNQGPGSFTGLRVGISVVNALSHFLKIPIGNKKIGQLANPTYE